MQVALLHFDLSAGPAAHNMAMLCQGIRLAAAQKAKWVITPEMALQGYFFTQLHGGVIRKNMRAYIRPILALAKELNVFVFLGCAEHNAFDDKDYNSCLVIDNTGHIIARHHKMKIVHSKAEEWAFPGEKPTCVECDLIFAGVLVCADAYFTENSEQLGRLGADALVVLAAWPPGCGDPPEVAWERCSRSSGGLPVLVCNQTGTVNGLDCTIAKSAVVFQGELQMEYSGDPAILLADLDFFEKKLKTKEFTVMKFDEGQRF